MFSVHYRLRRRLGCDSPLSHRHRRLPRGRRAHPVPLPLHRRQGPLRGPPLYRISGREFETGLRHATKSLIIQENDLFFQFLKIIRCQLTCRSSRASGRRFRRGSAQRRSLSQSPFIHSATSLTSNGGASGRNTWQVNK